MTTFDKRLLSLAKRTICEQSHLMYTRYFFKVREEMNFITNWHHRCIGRALDDVAAGKIQRLLITVAPGFTKSMFMLDAISKSLGNYPLSRNILVNYNSTFARSNSQIMLDTIETPEYQDWWNVKLRHDVSSKGRWLTKHNGGVVASGVHGTILGFRAGRMTPGFFSGALWMDDLIKPADVHSKLQRDKVNTSMVEGLRSRLAIPETPIIHVMQRLHDNDPAGFSLKGGTGDQWHHLNIPAKMTKESMNPGKEYAKKYPYGIPLVYPDLFQKGWTWPMKVDKKEYNKVKAANPFVAAAQLMQEPRLIEGNFIKGKWLRFYNELPDKKFFTRIVAISDTALEGKLNNDRTVWTVWGQTRDGKAWLLDYFGGRMEVPDVEKELARVWTRWRNSHTTGLPRMTEFHIEKKASGHGIIQKFKRAGISVQAIERNKDKVYRAMECIPALRTGTLMLPSRKFKGEFTRNQQWAIMMAEIMEFSADMSHANDDFCDCIFDAGNIFYNANASIRQIA